MSRAEGAYYPAIDGLRAVAVLAVVFYHLDGSLLRGGFVGVDVFFVISGFVVSLSMAHVAARGLGAFTTFFYARRILRIAPALVVCLSATVLLACLLIPRAWLSDGNRATGLAAFFGLSNFVLARPANDYFSPRAEFNPFTHTWSLAVEEQFYFVFPLLMFFFTRASQRPAGRRASAWVLAGLTLASLVCCAWWTTRQPTYAFYLIPARFWELGFGMALFMSRGRWQPMLAVASPFTVRVTGWVLIAGVAASLLFAQAGAFPFPWALLPVVCTTGLLALIIGRTDAAVPRWLRAAPVVYIGKISYSLYLWHWPVFVLLRWTLGIESPAMKLLGLALAIGLAAASHRFVELPLRYAPWARKAPRWRVVAGGLGCVALATGVAALMFRDQDRISLSVTADHETWLPDSAIQAAGAPPACTIELGWQALEGGTVQTFKPAGCPLAATGQGRVIVAGDSHAWGYSAMLRLYAQRSGREVLLVTKGGCSLFDLQRPMADAAPDCRRFTDAALRELTATLKPGDVLFLPSLRVPRYRDQWGGVSPRLGSEAAASARRAATQEAAGFLRGVTATGVRIVFEAPKPLFKAPPFRCADWFNRDNPICAPGFTMDRTEIEALRAPALASIRELSAQLSGSTLWDPLPSLCSATQCTAFRDGAPLYFDGDHLSGVGNMRLVDAFEMHMRSIR